jgi:hypothetical protein
MLVGEENKLCEKKVAKLEQMIEENIVEYQAHSRNTEKLKMTKALVGARAAALEEQCQKQEQAALEAEGETAFGRELEEVRRARSGLEAEAAELEAEHGEQREVERETEERRAEVARQVQESGELEDECQLLQAVILERRGLVARMEMEARVRESKLGAQARQLVRRKDALLVLAEGRAGAGRPAY